MVQKNYLKEIYNVQKDRLMELKEKDRDINNNKGIFLSFWPFQLVLEKGGGWTFELLQ
jgi:hypothetical protein